MDQTKRYNKRQQVTIKEVAERAGVSQMTVSRVLNRQTAVKEETRARVEAAIAELNYRPNMLARSLAGGKALFIGLIFNNPSHSYLGELLVGALERCREGGHHLVIEDFSNEDTPQSGAEIVRRMHAAGVDGLIVAPPISENPDMVAALREAGLDFVLIAPVEDGSDDLYVTIDDAGAARDITQHLIDHGHARIGFVRGPANQSASDRRYAGYREALARNDIPELKELVQDGQFTFRSGMQAAEHLLGLPIPPTAIFASNDDMAAGVITAAHRLGLRVPKDLSVVGFDDTSMASAIWPPLTTMRQPIAEMGRRAVALLSSVLASDGKPPRSRRAVLDVALVERESVAGPNSR